jgi:Rod binding domain-containing protein
MSEYPLPLAQTPRPLPQQRALALQRPGWPQDAAPLPLARANARQADIAATAQRFEAMILEQLLSSTRKASLGGNNPLTGNTELAAGQDIVHQQIDRTRAELIARAAPLGVARLLEHEK